MKVKELQNVISERIQILKTLFAQLRKEHSESKNTIAFIKEVFTREILEKKERIPGALVAAWFLILLIACYDWTFGMNWSMVFNLGVLPLIAYYIVRSLRQTPSN